jgi:hypothetical protein
VCHGGKRVVHQQVFMMHTFRHAVTAMLMVTRDAMMACTRVCRQSIYIHTQQKTRKNSEVKSVFTLDLLCANSTCGPGHFSIQIAAQS